MLKPVSAISIQHTPKFTGIFRDPPAGEDALKVVHKGTTGYVSGGTRDLLVKLQADDAQSSPKRSAARGLLDYVVGVLTGHRNANARSWEDTFAADMMRA